MRRKLLLVLGLAALLLGPIPGLTQFQQDGGNNVQGGSQVQQGGFGGFQGGRRGRRGGGGGGQQGGVGFQGGGQGGGGRRNGGAAGFMGITNGQTGRAQFVSAPNQGGTGGRNRQPGPGPGVVRQGNGDWITTLAEREFSRLDQNKDGMLNYDEMSEELRAERDKWDTDKNGLIDPTEFRAFVQARVQQAMQDRMAAAQYVQAGSNGAQNGEPDEPKQVVYRAGKMPPGFEWFTAMDKDGDGQIGLYEWRTSGRAIEEFERMDRNGDGFLTVSEVLRYSANQAKIANGTANLIDWNGRSSDRATGPASGSPSGGINPGGMTPGGRNNFAFGPMTPGTGLNRGGGNRGGAINFGPMIPGAAWNPSGQGRPGRDATNTGNRGPRNRSGTSGQ